MNNAMETIRQAHETKAIKQHVCDFCSEKIQIGETYFSSTHTHDGTIYDWKTHKGCNFIANKLDMYDNCDDGLTGDDFMEKKVDPILDKITRQGIQSLTSEEREILEKAHKRMKRD